MHSEAIRECETALELLQKRQPAALWAQGCGWVYASAGRRREALEIAKKLEKAPGGRDRSIQLAHIYDALGDSDRALEFLARAYKQRSADLPTRWMHPMISDRLRADPRFQELIRRTGIPWAKFPPNGQTAAGKAIADKGRQ
jgi:tetratricopeptide (TPR) repeat protein